MTSGSAYLVLALALLVAGFAFPVAGVAQVPPASQNQGVGDALRRLEDNQQALQRQVTEIRILIAERVADKESTARLLDATNKSIDRLQTVLMFALGFLGVIAGGALYGAVSLNSLRGQLSAVEGLLRALYERLGEVYPRSGST
jgi:hypothetical protein